MSLPQAALYVIGMKQVTGFRPIKEDFQNLVWHVTTRDGQGFFVKQASSDWAWQNEVRACTHLQDRDIPGPALYAAFDRTLIYLDLGQHAPVIAREACLRGAGRMLRRLHDSGPLDSAAMNEAENTLVLTARRRAMQAGYRPPTPLVPTHGDGHPGNMILEPDDGFSHFIDFEEFWGGDALTDLMIAGIESCRFSVGRMPLVLTWLLQGYFAWDEDGPRLDAWRDPAQRSLLAAACYDSLIDWAHLSRLPEEAADLQEKRQVIMAAITDHTLSQAA